MPPRHLIYEPLIIPKRYNISYDLLIPWNLTLAPQHEDSGAQEEDTQEHYDPIAAATQGWGDDGTRPVRYDPIAAATEGWGDDGTKPVRYDSVTSERDQDDDEIQQAHYDPMAGAQAAWDDDESQPVTEVAAAEDEAPAAETPTEAPPETPAEEEASQADAALDGEEGQVIRERERERERERKKVERCIWTKMADALIFLRRKFEHEVLEMNRW